MNALPSHDVTTTALAVGGLPITAETENTTITALKKVCIQRVSDFSAPASCLEKYSSKVSTSETLGLIGASEDNEAGAQIKPNLEYAITAKDRTNQSKLSIQFQKTVFGDAFANAGQASPLQGKVGEHKFIFLHDTNGDEAFVMLRK